MVLRTYIRGLLKLSNIAHKRKTFILRERGRVFDLICCVLEEGKEKREEQRDSQPDALWCVQSQISEGSESLPDILVGLEGGRLTHAEEEMVRVSGVTILARDKRLKVRFVSKPWRSCDCHETQY